MSGCGNTKNDPVNSNSTVKPQTNQEGRPSAPIGDENNNIEPSSTNPAQPQTGNLFKYHFRVRTGNLHCTTGRKFAKTFPNYCTLLMNETANRSCAQEQRKKMFDKWCAPTGLTWAPTEGDKEPGHYRPKMPRRVKAAEFKCTILDKGNSSSSSVQLMADATIPTLQPISNGNTFSISAKSKEVKIDAGVPRTEIWFSFEETDKTGKTMWIPQTSGTIENKDAKISCEPVIKGMEGTGVPTPPSIPATPNAPSAP